VLLCLFDTAPIVVCSLHLLLGGVSSSWLFVAAYYLSQSHSMACCLLLFDIPTPLPFKPLVCCPCAGATTINRCFAETPGCGLTIPSLQTAKLKTAGPSLSLPIQLLQVERFGLWTRNCSLLAGTRPRSTLVKVWIFYFEN